MLTSFGRDLRVVVLGASGAIGSAVTEQLLADPNISQVYAFSRQELKFSHPKLTSSHFDLEQEASLAKAAELVREPVELIFVASGLLHEGRSLKPEKSLRELTADGLQRVYAINAVGPILALKAFTQLVPRKKRATFAALSARVGSIEDNRLGGWYAYRASKAALNMLLKTASIELARTHPQLVVTGLHPGTVDSALSKPYQRNVPVKQLFEPTRAAKQLLEVIDGLNPQDSGSCFDWQGQRIPF